MARIESHTAGVYDNELRVNIERFVQNVGRIGMSQQVEGSSLSPSFDFEWHTQNFKDRDDGDGGSYAKLDPTPYNPMDDGSAARIDSARELVHAA